MDARRCGAWPTLLTLLLSAVMGSACGDDDDGVPSGGGELGGMGGGAAGAGGAEGGAGGETTDPRFQPLIEAIEAEREELGAPGVAVAVIERGEITFARGFGSKDPDNPNVPVLPTTLFRIGSVNKMLTAATLLQSVELGDVDLDASLSDYVPEFDLTDSPGAAATIAVRDLLRQSSGLYDYLRIRVPAAQAQDESLAAFLTGPSFESNEYMMAPAGAMWNYSNPNFYLSGLIAETVSNQPYRTLMKERLFDPLGMSRTFFLGSEVEADGDYALGLSGNYDGIPRVVAPTTYDNAWARPAGYATSSVLDLAKFTQFLIDGNPEVLSDELRTAMQSPQMDMLVLEDRAQYGFGLFVQQGFWLEDGRFIDERFTGHGGDIPGFAADIEFLPEQRFAVIFLSNADFAHFSKSSAVAIATLVDLPEESPEPDLTVDPETFDAFAGTYAEDHNVLGPIVISRDGDDLLATLPSLDAVGYPYEPVLIPQTPGNFVLLLDGYPLSATFIPDEEGVYRYFRTRAAVGIRETTFTFPQPTQIDVARLKRLLAQNADPHPWRGPIQ